MEENIYEELVKDAREYFCEELLGGTKDEYLDFDNNQLDIISEKTGFAKNSIINWFTAKNKGDVPKRITQGVKISRLCFLVLRYWKKEKEGYGNIEIDLGIPSLLSDEDLKKVDRDYISSVYLKAYIKMKKERINSKSSIDKNKIIANDNRKNTSESQKINKEIESISVDEDEIQNLFVVEEDKHIYVNQDGKNSILINNLSSFWKYHKKTITNKSKVNWMWGVLIIISILFLMFLYVNYFDLLLKKLNDLNSSDTDNNKISKNILQYGITLIFFGAQWLLSLLAFVFFVNKKTISIFLKGEYKSDTSLKLYVKFYFGWMGIWTVWFFMYSFSTAFHLYNRTIVFQPLYEFLAIFSTSCAFYMFIALYVKSLNELQDKDFFKYFKFAVLVLFITGFIAIYDRFHELGNFDKFGIGLFRLTVAIYAMYLFAHLSNFTENLLMRGLFYSYPILQVFGSFIDTANIIPPTLQKVALFFLKVVLAIWFYKCFADGTFKKYFNGTANDMKKQPTR